MIYQASGVPLAVLKDSILWLFADRCGLFLFFLSEMGHILIVLSLRSVKFPEVHRDAGASARVGATHPSPHFFNAVWFYCHFLWWKVINPILPFPSPLPLNYVSSSQHLWSVEREHCGADRPSFIPREMGCSCAAPGPSPLIRKLPLLFFFLLSFHRGFAMFSDEELADYFRQGFRFFQQQGGVIILCNTESFYKKRNTLTHHIQYVWQLVNISVLV